MSADKPNRTKLRKQRVAEAIEILTAFQFGQKQRNKTAAYTLLALLDLAPDAPWKLAGSPLRGITPILEFIAKKFGASFAANTREQFRDNAVKFFVDAGLLLRNPDKPDRPITSPNTVYQIEPAALATLRKFGTPLWKSALKDYLASIKAIKQANARKRNTARVPVTLPDGKKVGLSPGGQNPLIKAVIEQFCPTFSPGGVIIYIGDTENKFAHLEKDYLASLGIKLDPAAKMPDVIVHFTKKNWLLLIEAVASDGSVDEKRRKELKKIFSGSTSGLVFVTAFETRQKMRSELPQIAWESEVWIAEDPEHMIHFNGEKFLGPYPDTLPPA